LPTVFENYTAQMKRETDVVLLHLWDTAGSIAIILLHVESELQVKKIMIDFDR